MICKYCGNVVDADAEVCPYCGSEDTWLLRGSEISIKEIEGA